ncbi:hypothetical protein [Amycolatopsis sp. MtRt-6]|uniref:hypothetical protein n=1 Tax=Amycolatopsis sp. MtRt-6 TaxID=2792782 RepID=UPI001A8D92F5|nr:hypothetical protein [Amycolatopsis sp. MtRt-6]
MRSTLRGSRAAVVVTLVPAGLLLAGAGSAFAAVTTTAQSGTNAESFGVLGPVGLVAVALGIVGMTLGVLRQRRKTRAAAALAEATPVVPDGPVTAMAEAVLAEPMLREPMIPEPMLAQPMLAQPVLAEPDVTPTRPFLAPRPNA